MPCRIISVLLWLKSFPIVVTGLQSTVERGGGSYKQNNNSFGSENTFGWLSGINFPFGFTP